MTKTNKHNTVEISVTQKAEEYLVPVQVVRGVGRVASDHGTRGYDSGRHMESVYRTGNKLKLLEVALDAEVADGIDDFAKWEEELTEVPKPIASDEFSEWSTETPPKNTDPKPVIDWESIMSDLEKVGLTKKDIKAMSDEQLEELKHKWYRRAKKS